jgi:hypothetical protein
MFTMVKPFVPECVLGTIKVFGGNKAEWNAALLEEIDADQLLAFYGGTMTDPDGDPKCPSKVLSLSPFIECCWLIFYEIT